MDFRNREQAYSLLVEYTESRSLLKHALAVEASMRAYARKFGEDPEEWGNVGLLHDFDYEKHPTAEGHPYVGVEILRQKGFPDRVLRAILAHADYTGVRRESTLDRALYACDEVSGFVTAVALVRPTKSIFDVDVAGVRKKLKDKAFAKGVNRDDVLRGAEELDVPLDEHIAFVIEALKGAADVLELRGVTA